MCYSAMVEADFKKFRQWPAEIHQQSFEDLFLRRLDHDSIKIGKAMEANFYDSQTPVEIRIKSYIGTYHAKRSQKYETALFEQTKRLNDAERKLAVKETKGALESKRIAGNKIEWNRKQLADLRRAELKPSDSRIFPLINRCYFYSHRLY